MTFENRDVFVGRTDILNEFRGSFIVKQQKDASRIYIIKSQPGTGKSKLLEVFDKTAQSERLKIFPFRIPIGLEKLKYFPKVILESIQNILPTQLNKQKKKERDKKWKGKKPFPEWTPVDLSSNFFTKLEEIDEDLKLARDAVIFLLDNVENLVLKQDIAEETVSLIFKMADWIIENKANIIMVFSIDSNYLESLKHDISRYHVHELPALDMRESEVLIRRLEKEITGETINREIHDEIIKLTDRTPFSIISVLSYIASKEKNEIGSIFELFESTETDEDDESSTEELDIEVVDSLAWKSLKEELAGNYLEDLLNLKIQESKLINFLLPKSQDNLFSISDMNIPKDLILAIDSLVEKKIMVKEDDFFQFTSSALFFALKQRSFKPNILTELKIYLDLIKTYILQKLKTPFYLITTFEKNIDLLNQQDSTDVDKSLAYDIAVKTEIFGQNLFELKYFHDAFILFIGTGNLFNLAGDIERAASTFENSSKLFIENSLPVYGKKLLIEASELFSNTGLDYKAKSMAREALWLIEEIADDYSSRELHNLARVYYYHAQKLCDIADESDKKQELIEKAISSSGNSEIRKAYFEKLLMEGNND